MINYRDYQNLHEKFKTKDLFGRYITNKDIEPLIKQFSFVKHSVIGYSVNHLPIYGLEIGNGPKKILMWSQMHGNESTTTKAIFDLINTIESGYLKHFINDCTLYIIPILNPDGAQAYTRLNANSVDLNRDAQNLSQPESIILRRVFDEFKPDICFNLHGQRTIFSAGKENKPATVSFLAPAQDEKRSITNNRKKAMELIAVMNNVLQNIIPQQIGIYDDSFNINCVGDTFQSMNVPTVLFEAGHINQDYNREKVRNHIYIAISTCIDYISNHHVEGENYKSYLKIPENNKLFYDIIVRNARIDMNKEAVQDIAIQYHEILENETLRFIPKIEKLGELKNFYAHREIDANGGLVNLDNDIDFKEGIECRSIYVNDKLFSLKPLINQ